MVPLAGNTKTPGWPPALVHHAREVHSTSRGITSICRLRASAQPFGEKPPSARARTGGRQLESAKARLETVCTRTHGRESLAKAPLWRDQRLRLARRP